MIDFGARRENNLIPPARRPQTKIRILAIHKIIIAPKTDLKENFRPNQHGRTGDIVGFPRLRVPPQRLLFGVDVPMHPFDFQPIGLAAVKPNQVLVRKIVDPGAANANFLVFFHQPDQFGQKIRLRGRVVVQKQNKFAVFFQRFFGSKIITAAKTQIFFAQKQFKTKILPRFFQLFFRLRRIFVVHHKNLEIFIIKTPQGIQCLQSILGVFIVDSDNPDFRFHKRIGQKAMKTPFSGAMIFVPFYSFS